MSDNIYNTLQELMNFNYTNIYYKANTIEQINNYKKMFNYLFDIYLFQFNNSKLDEDIYTVFLNDVSSEYITKTPNERKTIDYIVGMTDEFFKRKYEKYV